MAKADATTIRTREEAMRVATQPALASLLASPFRRHVTDLRFATEEALLPKLVPLPMMVELAAAMSHLTRLSVGVVGDAGMSPFTLPPQLTSLELCVQFPSQVTAKVHAAMCAALGQTAASLACLQSLHVLTLNYNTLSVEFFQPLVALPALTSLECDDGFSMPVIPILRRLAHLRRLKSHLFSVEQLARLVSGEDAPIPPLEVPPTYFWGQRHIDATVAGLLARLPTLTELQGVFDLPDVGPLLRGLPNLRDLVVMCEADGSVEIDPLVAGLKACAQLTSLSLEHPRLTHAHLVDLLPALSQLVTLHIELSPTAIDELEFLLQAPGITKLDLGGQQRIPLRELRHLDHLPALESLSLTQVFAAPLDDLSHDRMTPGSAHFDSAVWPRLKQFRCID